MSLQLAGKIALVTGGGRGIGRAVSLAFAAQGVSVALCGRTKETLDATADEIREHGVDAWPIVAARISAPLRMSNGVVNAGVANFTKSFADFVAKDRVTVNCVHPGATATERMMKNVQRRASDAGVSVEEMTARTVSEIPLGRLIAPEDIAQSVTFFCSPMASMVTGQVIAVDGGSAPAINY